MPSCAPRRSCRPRSSAAGSSPLPWLPWARRLRRGRRLALLSAELEQQNGELERRGERLAVISLELEQRNGELEQRSASRIRLLAAACHDLRQPAHALGVLAELGSDAQQEPSRFGAWLQSVKRSTASLGEMLDELMDLGRLDGGHYTPQLSDVSLAELLQDVALHFGGLARRKGLTLEVVPADGHVVSDRHLLRRIVFNLVSNAIKYTDTGFVRVSAQPDADADAVQLRVQDSGPGIPPDKLDDVFRDYVRLNPTKAAEGLGIGLSIVRRAAELLGHGLTLASPPGGGCGCVSRAHPAAGASRGAGSRHHGPASAGQQRACRSGPAARGAAGAPAARAAGDGRHGCRHCRRGRAGSGLPGSQAAGAAQAGGVGGAAASGAHSRRRPGARGAISGDTVVAQEALLANLGQCIRDVKQARDGALVFITDSGRLYRVAR